MNARLRVHQVSRCAIFIDDVDRQHFCDLLGAAVNEHAIALHAYVLMGNHVHLLLTPPHGDALSRAMRNLGQCYVQAFNRRHRRIGTLWQGRYKSCLVNTDDYLLKVYRYIELNPVRAGMVERPEQHRWSSIHANLARLTDPLVTAHAAFTALGPDCIARAEVYAARLREGTGQGDLDQIRAHIQQERAFGDRKFQTMIGKTLGRPVRVKPRGRPRQVRREVGNV